MNEVSRFIIGAGRHAEETFYLLEDLGESEQIAGFVVDDPTEQATFLGRPVYATSQFLDTYSMVIGKPSVLVAIGHVSTNKRFCTILKTRGFPFFQAIAPEVPQARQRYIGQGVCIARGTILTTNISIGDFSIINIGCTISHDVAIGNHVNISPGVHLAGHVVIEDEVFLGIGASVIPKVRIGKGSVVAAGACVTQDVPPHCMVAGVPAQIKKRFSFEV